MSEPQVPYAMTVICKLGMAVGAAPLNKLPGLWEFKVDERWWFAMNGHRETINTSDDEPVKPFTCYIKYNGWPAGILDFGGGIIAAGEGANEDTFIAALEAALTRARP